MKEELFALCDGAYNYDGKMTIVATRDGFNVPSLPFDVNFSIALKLNVQPGESGQHVMSLRIIDPVGNELPAVMNINLDIKEKDVESHVVFAANLNGVPFKLEGTYKILVLIDEETIGNHSFYINIR